MEEWKWIEGYEDEYKISNHGRIKSFKGNKEKIMTLKRDGKDRYLMIALSKLGEVKYYLVHRLVAMAFIHNPNNLPQVNHIDGNTKNNHIKNLEWVTGAENIHHAYENNLIKIERGVLQLDLISGKIVREYKSITEASEVTGINKSTIQDNACGRYLTDRFQYTFIYSDSENVEDEIINRLKKVKVVQMLDKDTNEVIKEFLNQKIALKEFNSKSGAINNCLKGRSNTAFGYKWKFKWIN